MLHGARSLGVFALVVAFTTGAACADTAQASEQAKPYEPVVGQAGRDVVWVPTPYVLVEHMLDVARVTAKDFVMDLGSGDGRNVIAAAKRGARAVGVEYNPEMVALSQANAAKEGVAERATFVQGDMYEADVSRASVLALFLLGENLRKLTPKFLDMRPGSRIVTNGYQIPGWEAEQTSRSKGDCGSWCTAYLYIVPAKVAGTWQLPQGELVLSQDFQMVSGTLKTNGASVPIARGRLYGDRINFTAGSYEYVARVRGDSMQGKVSGQSNGAFRARRIDAH
jgi:SAM-dependent methyltransferase